MVERILFVDDELNILAAHRRVLRGTYEIETRAGARAALETMRTQGPFSVVVSDLRMPVMDGAKFLAAAKEEFPETVRIMLTGQADLNAAMEVVNRGLIFRFLLKPCSKEQLMAAIQDGIRQRQLLCAERELLENTLRGCVKVLTDVLAIVNPRVYGKASRVCQLIRRVQPFLSTQEAWSLEVTAMLSHLGTLGVSPEIVEKALAGKELSPEEQSQWERHPYICRDLLAHIPRLEGVRENIVHQMSGARNGVRNGACAEIPLGARLLRIVSDFDSLCDAGAEAEEALLAMGRQMGRYDGELLDLFRKALVEDRVNYVFQRILVKDLEPGMILREPLRTDQGVVLVGKGQEINLLILQRVRTYAASYVIEEPVGVDVPRSHAPKMTVPVLTPAVGG